MRELPADELASTRGTLPLAALAARREAELARVSTPDLAAFHDPTTQDERENRAALYLLIGGDSASNWPTSSLSEISR